MKKVIKLFVFFLIIMLVFPMNIMAKAEVNADQQAGLVYGCGVKEWCWPEGDFGGLVNGIRVSFYNRNAQKIGKSLDFINNNTAYNYLTNHDVYAANTKNDVTTSSNTKLDYIAKGYDYDGTNTDKLYWWWFNYGYVADINYLEFSTFLTGKSGISGNVFKDYLRISDLNDIAQRFEEFEDQFQFPSGITLNTITANARNYYMIIEPVTVLVNQYTKKYYYGTYTELQMLRLSYEKTTIRGGDRLVGVDILFRKNVTESSGYSLAKSIYLGKDISTDTSSDMGEILKKLHNNTDNKDVANSYNKYNVYSDILDNGYGIGAMWLNDLDFSDDCNDDNPNWNATTKKCTSSVFKTCTVKTPNLDVCATDNGNALEYEYTNCTLNDDDSNYIIGEIGNDNAWFEKKVARIQCSEKYYVATFQVRNTFKTITSSTTEEKSGSGILAGAYYSIDGPVVYHKKTCEFIDNISNWESFVNSLIQKHDTVGGCKEYVLQGCDENGCHYAWEMNKKCKQSYEATRDHYSNLAKDLKDQYNGMKDTLNGYVTNNTSPDTLPDLKLNTIISKKEDTTVTYDLTPTFNRLEDLRNEFGYGYKTTYTYGLKQKNGLDINRYISLISSSDALTSSESKTSVDLGGAKITTQINLKEGEYNYNINYQNIFNDIFKNIINKYGKYNIDSNNEVTSKNCPYIIYARNISSFCETNCGDPNTEFTTPKINMVYRAIDLSNPFPGYTGSGRESGLNWDTNSINQYITFNRNIVIINGDKTEANPDLIYQEEPLYTIKLDSTTIKAIREYNDTHAYDDFTLECTEGTECFSTFLKDYNLITGGTCANATTDTFYSCADK